MNEINLKKFWDALQSKFDVGSFDEFKSKMLTPDMRKRFYDVLNKKYDLGSYDEYEKRLSISSSIGNIAGTSPKQTQNNNVGSISAGKGISTQLKPKTSIYHNCTDFPFEQFCRSPKIKEIQTCLGFPLKYQTGNFGPITKSGLINLNKDLSQGITQKIYNEIISACGAPKPQSPPLNPGSINNQYIEPGNENNKKPQDAQT